MAGVKLVTKLPPEEGNGLEAVAEHMVSAKPGTMYLAVALIDCQDVNVSKDNGTAVPRARIRRIEVVVGEEDVKEAQRLLRRALDHRQGRTTLPLSLEVDLESVFIDFPDDKPGDPGDGTGAA